MPRLTSFADFMQDWEELLAAVNLNAAELPELEITSNRLAGMLNEARLLVPQQAVHTAAKQDRRQQLAAILNQGRPLATAIRLTVKAHYGSRSEKLAEFHIQPFRSKTVPPKVPPPETVAPPASPDVE